MEYDNCEHEKVEQSDCKWVFAKAELEKKSEKFGKNTRDST